MRRTCAQLGVVLACALAPAPSAAQRAASSRQPAPPAPAVRIESPHGGVVPGPVVWLEASVSDPAARHATLVVNGAAYDVPVEQGRVRQQVIAVPGINRVGLAVDRPGGVARDSVTFRYEGPPVELAVLLSWPSEGEIIDLWVREPGGETCKWDHRQTLGGGRLLDFSSDAIGFGSQAYVLSAARAGSFRLKVHYWGAFAEEDRRGRYVYDDLLRRLDDVHGRLATASRRAERGELRQRAAELERSLDAWAGPAAPQTAVHAEVVLLPGTRFERRWRFDRVVQRTGQLLTLGQVEIDADVLAAARREER